MNWRTLVAVALVGIYIYGSVLTGNWSGSIHLLAVAFAFFVKGQQVAENARQGVSTSSGSPVTRAFEALRMDNGVDAGSTELEVDEDEDDLTPMMSDADYARIVRYLSSRMPFMTVNTLYDPTMRRFIETKLLEGRGIGDLEAMLGVPAVAVQEKFLETSNVAMDPRMRAAKAANQAQIDGLIAAIPKSKTAEGIAQNARTRMLRQHRPQAVMIMNGLKAGSRQIRVRMRQSRMQLEIASALKYGIHAGLAELQALRAPVTRITRDGRLTSASTELHSIPPRFIR